jgi:hypothetical protein
VSHVKTMPPRLQKQQDRKSRGSVDRISEFAGFQANKDELVIEDIGDFFNC